MSTTRTDRPRFLWVTRSGAILMAWWAILVGAHQNDLLGPAPAWTGAVGALGVVLWMGGRAARWLVR